MLFDKILLNICYNFFLRPLCAIIYAFFSMNKYADPYMLAFLVIACSDRYEIAENLV